MLLRNKLCKVLFALLFVCSFQEMALGQNEICARVLKKNKVGKVYSFDSSSRKDGFDKIYIAYLGCIKTSKGEGIKILSWSRIWGVNRHTSGVIYIYDSTNKYIGKYNLGSSGDLPSKIENTSLVFINKNKIGCDSTLVTKIDFSKGVPEEIFLKCKGSSGDIYSLSTTD